MIADGCAGTKTENQKPQKEGNQVQTYTNGSLTYIFSVSLVRYSANVVFSYAA